MPNVTITVKVRTAAPTHDPVVGAQVFVNALGNNNVTDSSGQVNIVLPSSTAFDLSVKAAGFADFSAAGISSSQSLFIVNMQPVASSSTATFNLTVQPDTPAVGATFTFDNNGSPLPVTYLAGGKVVDNLTVGGQTITANITGYNPVLEFIDTSKASSTTILLVATTDSGLPDAQQASAEQDPDVSVMLPALVTQQLPEFIAPNTGQGTYFTMTQARMYIGNMFIDELSGLQWALQDNKIPVYGYASRFWDGKAQGRSLVQGQFSINFISEGYLYTVLQAYSDFIDQSELPVDPVKDQQQKKLLLLVDLLRNPDSTWTPAQRASTKIEVQNLAASLGPAAVTAANAGISLAIRKQSNFFGLPGGDYPNAVYQDISFDIIVEYTGAGRTITRKLEDCSLISNESIMDHSGTPILDSYGFIARRAR